jgi:hypothetical protein
LIQVKECPPVTGYQRLMATGSRDEFLKRAAALRERANQVRTLALSVTRQDDRDTFHQYADELDASAEVLERTARQAR